jgi:hypothetical protein
VVEGSGFENRRTRKGTRGSNPFSSAESIDDLGEAILVSLRSVTKTVTKSERRTGVRISTGRVGRGDVAGTCAQASSSKLGSFAISCASNGMSSSS